MQAQPTPGACMHACIPMHANCGEALHPSACTRGSNTACKWPPKLPLPSGGSEMASQPPGLGSLGGVCETLKILGFLKEQIKRSQMHAIGFENPSWEHTRVCRRVRQGLPVHQSVCTQVSCPACLQAGMHAMVDHRMARKHACQHAFASLDQ